MTLGIPECYSATYKPATTMPCGFESEPLDFDSAFSLANGVSDWPSLRDPTMTLENRSPTIESESNMTNSTPGNLPSCGKRKLLSDSEDVCEVKRARTDDAEDENTPPGGDDLLLSPVRRKGPQLWSPKLRWKDERKRVLKISMNKLRTIEDPEMFLRRSVLINNTMKRLQKEIREEKNARHSSSLHDPFGSDGFGTPLIAKDTSYGASDATPAPSDSWTLQTHQSNSDNNKDSRLSARKSSSEGASCDEIFGVNEDYLRINLPERISTSSSSATDSQNAGDKTAESAMDTSNNTQQTANTNNNNSSSNSSSSASSTCPCNGSCSCGRVKTNPRFYDPPVSRCCSTQYRNGQDALYFGDGSYCPHVSSTCVDSVIYHSLLASLES